MRRCDRSFAKPGSEEIMIGELEEERIDQILRNEAVGRIGCGNGEQIYVVPVTYVYDGKNVYGHMDEGEKVRLMRANPKVCFEVDHIENLANWQSVIVWGTYEELRGGEADKVVLLLLRKFSPLINSKSADAPHGLGGYVDYRIHTALRHGLMYRINVTKKTGRFEKTDEFHPALDVSESN